MPNIKSIPLKTKELQRYKRYAIGTPSIRHMYGNGHAMAMPLVYARDSPIPNQSGQQRSKSSGSFLGSKHIPSKASALIVTGIVKIQSISCQVPILFSTTDSWHEFDENISKDVLDNKYSSYSISYVCKGVDVLLTKSWSVEGLELWG